MQLQSTVLMRCLKVLDHHPIYYKVPDVNDGLSSVGGDTHKIFDTRDLSQVDLVYNHTTFQLSPGSNITNERSKRTDVGPRKVEI